MSQADRLREFFLNRDCPGIAKLVAYLAENPDLREIGSSSWIDNERVLDEITLAMRKYGFPHFRAIQVMLSHGAIVTSAVYMTVVEGFRPTWRSVKHVIIGGNLYMLAVGLINGLIGSNFMFIAHKPATASLLDVLPPWPWYLLYIEALGLVFVLLFYLPFAISDWRKGRLKVEQDLV